MITEDKVNKIYEKAVMNQELTTKQLNGLGFNSNDLAKLIENGVLTRVKRGYYVLAQIGPLYKYGTRILYKDSKVAYKYFQKCHEMEPDNNRVLYKLFMACTFDGDYKQSFEYLKEICESNNFSHTNNNFYLYLLSKLIDLPDNYQKMVKKFKWQDIKFVPAKGEGTVTQNVLRRQIRSLVFTNEFFKAYKICIDSGLLNSDMIIHHLLQAIVKKRKEKTSNILQAIKDKNYLGAIEILEQMGDLGSNEKTILLLLQSLNRIITTQKVPDKLDFKTDMLPEAIADENYDWALYLYEKHNSSDTYKRANSPLYLLLVAINEEIRKLENNQNEISEEEQSINPELICPALVHLLLRNDMERFKQYLPEYLRILKQDKYQFIIEQLLELDTLDQDRVFTRTVNFINHLTDDIPLNISEYMQCVIDSIMHKKLKHARIYLGIISSYSKVSHEIVSVGELEQVLGKMLSIEELEHKEVVADEQLEENSDIKPEIIDDGLPDNNIVAEVSVDNGQVKLDDILQKETGEQSFLQKKYAKLLEQQGIIILKPMKEERRNKLIELAQEYENMVVFTIGIAEPKRLVLRYKPRDREFIDIKGEFHKAQKLYKEHKYKDASKIYFNLLSVGTPNEYIYAKLGISYLKTSRLNLAIDYLTVATELSFEKGTDLDFSELIAQLRKEKNIEEIERKPKVKMNVTSFANDIDEYYGIDNVEGIANLVASGLDVKDACEQFNLTAEQMVIVLLIFARECYLQNNFTLGDYYFNKAERSKDKTPFLHQLLDNVRRNKKFYANRDRTNHKRLILLPEY